MKQIHLIPALFLTTGLASADLVITEIDLAGNKIEIVNKGSGNENLTGYFLCNRLNGSPFYPSVTTSLIDGPNSDTDTLEVAPGEVLTLQMTAGFIPDGSGEAGLYLNSSFGSTTSLIDYVSWGADGVRDSVAASKGIWASATFVDVTGIQPGQTIQLGEGLGGNSKDDYALAESTIGIDQSSPAAPVELQIQSVSLSGGILSVTFTGPAGTAPSSWEVSGSENPVSFPDDKTSATLFSEDSESPGLFTAEIDVSEEGPRYFVKVRLLSGS